MYISKTKRYPMVKIEYIQLRIEINIQYKYDLIK